MGIRPTKKAPKPGEWVNDGDGNYSKQTARINFSKDNLVPEHDEIRHLLEVDHYGAHAHRTESEEFKHVKKEFHEAHAKCWIDNGKCEGGIEIHHSVIEYSMASEVDWNKVQKEYPGFTDVDNKKQMIPLCEKHHRKPGFGVHYLTKNIWESQKFLLPDALEKFEAATLAALAKDKKGE